MAKEQFLYLDMSEVQQLMQTQEEEVSDAAGDLVEGNIAVGEFASGISFAEKIRLRQLRGMHVASVYEEKTLTSVLAALEKRGLPKHEFLTTEDYNSLQAQDIIEISCYPRYSKARVVAQQARQILALAQQARELSGAQLLGAKTKQYLKDICKREKNESGDIACVMEIGLSAYPAIAYFKKDAFVDLQQNIKEPVRLLCRVDRKMEEGENVRLGAWLEKAFKFPPNEMVVAIDPNRNLRDVICGPALVVQPLAMYQ